MRHRYRISGRCGDHVDLTIDLRQRLLADQHGKCAGSGADITCAHRAGIGSNHAGSRIAFRRCHRDPALQGTGLIQELGACFRKGSGILSGNHDLRKNIAKLPGIIILGNKLIKLVDHNLVIVICHRIDREDTGSIADAGDLLAGQQVMNIGIQCGNKVHILQMRFLIQHTLIQMRDRPAERDIEVEQRSQLVSCLLCIGISPGLERSQKLSVLIQRNVAVHHGTDAHRSVSRRSNTILLLDILSHRAVAALQSGKDLLLGIGPDPVD